MSELLEQASKFCEYGQNYNRNIHAAAADLQDAIDRGFTSDIVDALADVLRLRLERWA
jgi:hypothetical protein